MEIVVFVFDIIFVGVLFMLYVFIGFEMVVVMSGEISLLKKIIFWVLMFMVLGIVIFYFCV